MTKNGTYKLIVCNRSSSCRLIALCFICFSMLSGCRADRYSHFESLCEKGLDAIVFDENKWNFVLENSEQKYLEDVEKYPGKTVVFHFERNENFQIWSRNELKKNTPECHRIFQDEIFLADKYSGVFAVVSDVLWRSCGIGGGTTYSCLNSKVGTPKMNIIMAED